MRNDGLQNIANANGVESLACAAAANEASDKFLLANVVKIGISATINGAGTVDVLLQLQVSNDGVTFAVETGYSDLLNLVAGTLYTKTIYDSAIPAFKYGRLLADGQGSNAAGHTLTGTMNLVREDN